MSSSYVPSVCPDGYADDTLYLYLPRPCSVQVLASKVLWCIWLGMFAIVLNETVWTQVLGKAKQSLIPGGQLTIDAVNGFWTLVGMALCATFIAVPNITVLDHAQGVALWVLMFLWTSSFSIYFMLVIISLGYTLASALSIQLQDRSVSDIMKTPFFRSLNKIQVIKAVLFTLFLLFSFAVVPNIVPDDLVRRNGARAGFIIFGVDTFSNVVFMSVFCERVRQMSLEQLKFYRDMPMIDMTTSRQSSIEAMEILAILSRRATIFVCVFGVPFSVVWIFVGAYLEMRWIVLQVFMAIFAFQGVCTMLFNPNHSATIAFLRMITKFHFLPTPPSSQASTRGVVSSGSVGTSSGKPAIGSESLSNATSLVNHDTNISISTTLPMAADEGEISTLPSSPRETQGKSSTTLDYTHIAAENWTPATALLMNL